MKLISLGHSDPYRNPTTFKKIARHLLHQVAGFVDLKEEATMHSTPVIESRTYTARQAATLLGIGHSTLCQAVREGRAGHLKPIRVGTTIRFPRTRIDAITLGGAA